MSGQLNVSLELLFEDEMDLDDLKELIADAVISNATDFLEILSRVCSNLNSRADYCDDSLEIESVNLDSPVDLSDLNSLSATGCVQVFFEWYAYYGCDDMNQHDSIDDLWNFEINGQNLNFSIDLPIERVDEI